MRDRDPFVRQLGATLGELEPEAIQELARRARFHEYEAGAVVFLEGEAARGLYYLQDGFIKVTKSSPEGREQILQLLEPGATFNATGALADRPNPATAIALEPTGVWILPREAVMDFLGRHPAAAQQVIRKMAGRILDLVSLVADLSLRTVSERLARLLLEDAAGDTLHRPRWYTQAEIAAQLGTVPDVVQRALSRMVADGLIEVSRDQILIRDREGLDQLAH